MRGRPHGFRIASDTISLLAGADEDDGTVFGHFIGELDDLWIWSRALGDAEIATVAIP